MTRFASNAKSLVRLGSGWVGIFSLMLALSFCLGWPALQVHAQTAGQGALQGTVTDSTGAVIPNATVKISNDATNIETTRSSNATGLYVISPVQPGSYTVTISAPGFKTIVQQNVVVDALQSRVFNPALSIGQESETIEVTAAPPVLDTADATLGLTVENESYTNLPIQMANAQQRDPTQFASLTPGAQTGTRLPVIGGTGNYLGQLYLDGMPATTVNQQGDNRVVGLSMSVEAVDQFQVLTSTPPAEYMGAGAMNVTMKSGGLKYHGQINDYIRNTFFDSWCFTCKASTIKNTAGATVAAPKPVEHQNEFSVSGGGVVPKTHEKLFFFAAYDKYYYRAAVNPGTYTIPTQAMLSGDFTELNGNVGSGGQSGVGTTNAALLYDPTSTTCTGSSCTRAAFQGTKNGVASYNVIPSAMLSPIAKAMASFMPAPSNSSTLTGNYLGTAPAGRNNHLVDWRVDYTINSQQRISSVGAMGDVKYLNNFSSTGSGVTAAGYLPVPYVSGTYADIHPKTYIVEHIWTVNPNLVNQIKYSFTRFIQPQTAATDGLTQYEPSTMGISNVPAGRAATTFPGASFGATGASTVSQTAWTCFSTSCSTQLVSPSTFALADNIQYLKGRHSMAFGFSHLWEEGNIAAPKGYSAQLNLNYNPYSTANISGTSLSGTTGYSFASYMLGAVGGSTSSSTQAASINLYPLSETGGRFHPIAIYFRDSIKVNQKLTVDIGMRWDYLPPFHEVKDRWTFLNPALTNPLTSTAGMLQFAGSWGGGYNVSCNCRTPVNTYWKNLGPRLGLAYTLNPKTVIRSGFAVVYSQAGGVGGRGGYGTGTGQTGFNMTATGPTESYLGPSYYLNNSTGFSSLGLSNTSLLGSGYTYPSAPTANVAAQELNTGNYWNDTAGKGVSAASVSYADPYFSGRAPQIVMWNLGVERSITPDLTLAVNYAGNESHFIVNAGTSGSNARGRWSNQVDPKYLAVLGSVKDSTGTKPILTSLATAANAAIVTNYFPTAPTPAFFTHAGDKGFSSATVAQMLTAFPQYSTVSDTWGNVGNFNYHALQVTLNQRMHKGLTYNINYTYSKNVGDDGTYRSGFDIPAAAISGGTKAYKQNRIDRGLTTLSAPHIIHAYGVYQLPFGKDKIGSNSRLVQWAAGGWQLSGIYQYVSGTPVAVTWSGASTSTLPLQTNSVITAMPDINTSFSGPARINGKPGSGPGGHDTCYLGINAAGQSGCTKIRYIDLAAFQTPTNASTVGTQYLIGNAQRTAAYGMRNPYYWNVDAGLRRSIPLSHGVEFVFEADVINVWNHVTFGGPSASWAAATSTTTTSNNAFGTISGTDSRYSPRDWQFAGHIKF